MKKTKLRTLVSVLLAAILLLSTVGCAQDTPGSSTDTDTPADTAPAETTVPSETGRASRQDTVPDNLNFNGEILDFDSKLPQTLRYIADNFGGDAMAFAKKYFATVATLPERAKIDILGHFDLIAKNNEKGGFLDTTSKEYLSAGYEAIDALKGKIPFFEVNTGAIARGYRTSPYPQMEFLKEFQKCGFGAVITSDCHNKAYLDCYYEEAKALLAEAGFKTRWILTDDGFREVAI